MISAPNHLYGPSIPLFPGADRLANRAVDYSGLSPERAERAFVALVHRCNAERGGMAYPAARQAMQQRCGELFTLATRAPRLANRRSMPGEEEMGAIADALTVAFTNRPRGQSYDDTLAKFRRDNPGWWETFKTSLDYTDSGLPADATAAQIAGTFHGLLNRSRRTAGWNFHRAWEHMRVAWPDLFLIANRLPTSPSLREGVVDFRQVAGLIEKNAARILQRGTDEEMMPDYFPMHVTERNIPELFWKLFSRARSERGLSWEASWHWMKENNPRLWAQFVYWA